MAGGCCAGGVHAWLLAVVVGVMRNTGRATLGLPLCLVCELCLLAAVCVDYRCSLSFVFLGSTRCWEFSSCNAQTLQERLTTGSPPNLPITDGAPGQHEGIAGSPK